METGHPSTRAVNSGSGNRALVSTNQCNNRRCHHFGSGAQNNAASGANRFFWFGYAGGNLVANEVNRNLSNKFVG